jgi:hypothetical protein
MVLFVRSIRGLVRIGVFRAVQFLRTERGQQSAPHQDRSVYHHPASVASLHGAFGTSRSAEGLAARSSFTPRDDSVAQGGRRGRCNSMALPHDDNDAGSESSTDLVDFAFRTTLTVLVFLNDTFEGGGIRVFSSTPDGVLPSATTPYVDISASVGRAVVLDHRVYHTNLSASQRKSMLRFEILYSAQPREVMLSPSSRVPPTLAVAVAAEAAASSDAAATADTVTPTDSCSLSRPRHAEASAVQAARVAPSARRRVNVKASRVAAVLPPGVVLVVPGHDAVPTAGGDVRGAAAGANAGANAGAGARGCARSRVEPALSRSAPSAGHVRKDERAVPDVRKEVDVDVDVVGRGTPLLQEGCSDKVLPLLSLGAVGIPPPPPPLMLYGLYKRARSSSTCSTVSLSSTDPSPLPSPLLTPSPLWELDSGALSGLPDGRRADLFQSISCSVVDAAGAVSAMDSVLGKPMALPRRDSLGGTKKRPFADVA